MTSEISDALNDGFVQLMHENWLANPASVSDEWRALFEQKNTSPQAGNTPTSSGAAATIAPPKPAPSAQAAPTAAKPAATAPNNAQQMKGANAGIAKNMNASLSVPTATTFRTIAVATLDQQRKQINEKIASTGRKLSFTHIVAWALVQAWKSFPVMGHAFEMVDGKPYRIANEHVNFGLAVDVAKPDGSRGLMVPCVKQAQSLSAVEFFNAYDAIVEKARTGSISLEDMLGTNVTLTNPGGLGTSASVPRLMQGQASIIATGSIAYPVEFQHLTADKLAQLGVSKVMTMTSTYDHRVIQGAESGRYLQLADQLLQGQHDFYETIEQSILSVATTSATIAPVAAPSPAAIPLPEQNEVMLEPGAGLVPVHGDLLPEPDPFPLLPAAKIDTNQDQLASVAAAVALVKAFRTHGHLAASLDPLGRPAPGDPSMDPATVGLTNDIMGTIPARVLRIGVEGETLADALPRLKEKYCGSIAYEIEHISDHTQRVWLRRMIEAGEHRHPLTNDQQIWLLDRLIEVEAFERFVRRAYLAQKQFSIEGLDIMVPMLDLVVEAASESGAHEVVLGMAHRGRLNILSHVIGLPYDRVLRFFEAESRVVEGTEVTGGGTGDVKYHMGTSREVDTPTGTINVTLMPNPSHLEVVNPVVEGRTRASQTLQRGTDLTFDGSAAVPVLIHGDAAFAGQGVVAETLNLQGLDGYQTGGTIHMIANNQIGFTTNPHDGRSTRYASDLAKGFDMPIIHVNADDPEACLSAMKLAVAYRSRFHEDVMIDLIGYRRHGHNETDEPAYTQPKMYTNIKKHPRVRDIFADQLIARGLIDADGVKAKYDAQYHSISKLHEEKVLALGDRAPSELDEPTGDIIDLGSSVEPDTSLSESDIRRLSEELLRVPHGFQANKKLWKQLEKRAAMPDTAFDWGATEALAYASLLESGVNIRLTGQDSERGTFAHRHMVLHEANTGEKYAPVQHLPNATAALEVYNSPLSELACLGFEYGYASEAKDSLVLWEGQFGDFVNGAQVVSDQFITSGMVKWGLTSRLTLLLPHGYEGNGPEHSNARLMRWLLSAAEGNMRVAMPTTAAQHFHLLRRQALIDSRRPLIVMTPKGLLRAPWATSPLSDLTDGRFEWVLDDPEMVAAPTKRENVTRLVLCSGKVYYDIMRHTERENATNVAVARIELLYPFPKKQVAELLASYPNLQEVVWTQEEPLNFGPFLHMHQRIPQLLEQNGPKWKYVGRPKRSSTSEGYTSVHNVEQERIARQALGLR